MRGGTERAEAWQKEGKKEIIKKLTKTERGWTKRKERDSGRDGQRKNGINAAVQLKREQKRMNKRVTELTKETVGVSDSSECGKIWNRQRQNMNKWRKHKRKTKRVWREGKLKAIEG